MQELSEATLWHGRLMVLAWVFLFPLGILLARFFKVMPNQNWPHKVDNKLWWYGHLSLQYTGAVVAGIALWLIVQTTQGFINLWHWHACLGWTSLLLLAVQLLSGWLRGSKGGPTDQRPDGSIRGDHFDMTLRRRIFEKIHKSNGYLALLVAVAAVLTGLNAAGAPVWMYVSVIVWWSGLLIFFVFCQMAGLHINTYLAIWGRTLSPFASQPRTALRHPWRSRTVKPESSQRRSVQ